MSKEFEDFQGNPEEMYGEDVMYDDGDGVEDYNDEEDSDFSDQEDIGEGPEFEDGVTPSLYKYEGHDDPVLKCEIVTNEDNGTLYGFYASQDDSASVMVFDTKNYMCLYNQKLKGFHDDSVVDVQLNFDKTLMATGGMDGTIGIYDISKLKDVTKAWREENEGNLPNDLVDHQVQLEGHDQEIEWLRWHPKGNALLSASADGTCWLWNVKTMKCMSVLAGHADTITCGGFAKEGKVVVTGSGDGSVKLWHPMHGTIQHSFEGDLFSQSTPIISMHIHDSTNTIYCGNEEGTVISCFIGDNPRILQRYTGGHTDSVECIDYSLGMPNIFASGSMDSTICVWDDRVNKLRMRLKSNDGVVKVRCSEKSPILYSAGMDGEVKIWDLRNGQCLDRLVGHTDSVLDFAVSSADEFIITASDDKSSNIYELHLDMLLQ